MPAAGGCHHLFSEGCRYALTILNKCHFKQLCLNNQLVSLKISPKMFINSIADEGDSNSWKYHY